MSFICLSWNSVGAVWLMTSPSRSNFASTPLKSKRVASSRLAWSMALVSSWVSTSDTTSKEGMGELRRFQWRSFYREGPHARLVEPSPRSAVL
jgi:hypothetical protein